MRLNLKGLLGFMAVLSLAVCAQARDISVTESGFIKPAASGSKVTVLMDKFPQTTTGEFSLQGDGKTANEIVDEKTGLGGKWPEFLQKGFLRVGQLANLNQRGQIGLLSSGKKKGMIYYIKGGRGPGFYSTTIQMVVKPTSDWNRGRYSLMGNGHAYEATTSLAVSNGVLKVECVNKTDRTHASAELKQDWKVGTWYYICASWQGAEPPVLYAQALSADDPKSSPKGVAGKLSDGSNPVVPTRLGRWGTPFNEPFVIGAGYYNPGGNAGTVDGAGADIAFFRMENDYSTADEMAKAVESPTFSITRDPSKRMQRVPALKQEDDNAFTARTDPEMFKNLKWTDSQFGREIDLSKFKRTFNDDFKVMDIENDYASKGAWFAPGHSTYGEANFMYPIEDGPYSIVKDGLRIRMDKGKRKQWETGNIQTVNIFGEGFAQKYGYFEATLEFPKGLGAWPAFWLLSQNGYTSKSTTRTEIDVIEWYGGDPNGHHGTVHLWPAGKRPADATITKHIGVSKYSQKVNKNMLKPYVKNGKLEGFHSYGAEVTPEWVIFYFDRKEIARIQTVEEFKTPLYMVVSLALHKANAAKAVGPMDLIVKNVCAYQPKTPYKE